MMESCIDEAGEWLLLRVAGETLSNSFSEILADFGRCLRRTSCCGVELCFFSLSHWLVTCDASSQLLLVRFGSSIIFNITASMLLRHLPDAEERTYSKSEEQQSSCVARRGVRVWGGDTAFRRERT